MGEGEGTGPPPHEGQGSEIDHEHQLRRAEAELEGCRVRRLDAVGRAQAASLARERAAKRTREDGEAKSQDNDGDSEMVAPLTPGQAEDMYRPQLGQKAAEVARLRELTGQLVPPPAAEGNATMQNASPACAPPLDGRGTNADRPPIPRRGARGEQADAKAVAGAVADGGGAKGRGAAAADGWRAPRSVARGRPPSRGHEGGSERSSGVERGRQSVPPAPRQLSEAVDEEMRKVREVARELSRRTVVQGEIAMQERMQELQRKEAERTAALLRAKAEIEARLSQQHGDGGGAEQHAPSPTFGPTGQRWDGHQRMLALLGRARSAGAGGSDTEMGNARAGGIRYLEDVSVGVPAAFRGSRWRGAREEEQQDQGRERSPRPGLPAFLRKKGQQG